MGEHCGLHDLSALSRPLVRDFMVARSGGWFPQFSPFYLQQYHSALV
jgi:hypothetical protein